jgi:hypothetical protein
MKINFNKENYRKIDIEKRAIELIFSKTIKRILKTIAEDAEGVYSALGYLPYKEMAKSYKEEFEVSIKKNLKKTVYKFGFKLRVDIEKKYNLYSKIEFKKVLTINDENIARKLENINNNFFTSSQVFFFNSSKSKSEFITNTNEVELERAVISGLKKFDIEKAQKEKEIDKLIRQSIINPEDERRIKRQIEKIQNQIRLSDDNKNKIVSKSIKENLLNKTESRAGTISSDVVGLGESWARYNEAKLINDEKIKEDSGVEIQVKKSWVTILDSKTREAHAQADGLEVEIDQPFIVDGEALDYPRDEKGSAGNIINCRCVAEYGV